jgi:DNA primase
VEKIENIPFYEALKILADRAGVSLRDAQKNKEDTRLIALLKDATDHFEKNLSTSPEAKQYLMERGLTDETIKTFHIGYAKNEWRDLFMYLTSRGYSPEEMEQAGIEIKALDERGNVKGWYDRFRGRVMFPIRNVSGATVGYSGRIGNITRPRNLSYHPFTFPLSSSAFISIPACSISSGEYPRDVRYMKRSLHSFFAYPI